MGLPLTDIHVIDAGGATTAYCAKLLWDLGAEVTVLELPAGHELRRRTPFHHDDPGRSLVFDWYHGGSTSLTIESADLEALRTAAAAADVVLVAPARRRGRPTTGAPLGSRPTRSCAPSPRTAVADRTPAAT